MSRAALLVLLTISLVASADTPTPTKWLVPKFHDLRIKLRDPNWAPAIHIRTWYFKGARQRNEYIPEGNTQVAAQAFIGQCDKQAAFHLDNGTRSYFPSHFPPVYHLLSGPAKDSDPNLQAEVVKITSVDTGERRQVGDYEARHLKTTITVEPNRESAEKPPEIVADSWYLDLPGLNCRAENPRDFTLLTQVILIVAQRQGLVQGSIVVTNRTGPTPDGLLIEETLTKRFDGKVIVNKTELLEISQEALDESLFTVPADYKLEEATGLRTGKSAP